MILADAESASPTSHSNKTHTARDDNRFGFLHPWWDACWERKVKIRDFFPHRLVINILETATLRERDDFSRRYANSSNRSSSGNATLRVCHTAACIERYMTKWVRPHRNYVRSWQSERDTYIWNVQSKMRAGIVCNNVYLLCICVPGTFIAFYEREMQRQPATGRPFVHVTGRYVHLLKHTGRRSVRT